MSIAVLISDTKDAARMIPWARTIARVRRDHLTIIIPQKEKGQRRWKEIDSDEKCGAVAKSVFKSIADNQESNSDDVDESSVNDSEHKNTDDSSTDLSEAPKPTAEKSSESNHDDFQPKIKIIQLSDPHPSRAVVEEIANLSISLLVLPAHPPSKSDDSASWQSDLFHTVSSDVMYLRDDDQHITNGERVLVITNGDVDDQVALQLGYEIAKQNNGLLTAAFVEPDIDEVAPLVGEKILDKIVRDSLGRREKKISKKIVLADSLQEGMAQLEPHEYDLILIGTRNKRDIRSILFKPLTPQREKTDQTTADDQATADEPVPNHQPALAIVRRGISFSSRVWLALRARVESVVPQLDRQQRISLVERIQNNSHWNFDFVALIFLSTLIASLGLIQNSPAVVIGAMLVAPLMTPIVAIGLGLAQSNIRLIDSAAKTVTYGFATALMVGLLAGFLTWPQTTNEMVARETPNFRDLIIALASGVAAAYAMGRPNLISALPGVAIAAALVPPVATSGIGLALGNWHLAGGALLLFFTNIVAIVLGTAFTFWAIGLSRSKKDGTPLPSWPRWLFVLLVVLTIILTALMSVNATATPESGSV